MEQIFLVLVGVILLLLGTGLWLLNGLFPKPPVPQREHREAPYTE